MSNSRLHQKFARTDERAFNMILANFLHKKILERSVGRLRNLDVWAECTQILVDSNKKPDIIFRSQNNVVVAVETEYESSNAVENEAKMRIHDKLNIDGGIDIKYTYAIKIPQNMAFEDQRDLYNKVEKCEVKVCIFKTESDAKIVRWPADEGKWETISISRIATDIMFKLVNQ